MTSATEPLLAPDFLRKLEQWSLALRRSTTGRYGGERRSPRHGHSTEFADFRNYVAGDDVRFVDWNLYARLEKLFLKLFIHQQELNVHVLVDLSESMTFGQPPKSLIARRIAAAIGAIALTHHDGLSVTIGAESAQAGAARFRLCRGRGFVKRMLDFVAAAPEGGALSLSEFVQRRLLGVRQGLVVLVTDFFDPAGHEAALKPIAGGRHEAIVFHVLDREEWEPGLRGDLKLIDSENDEPTEVSIGPAVLGRYRRRAAAWSEEIEAYCTRRAMTYLRVLNDAPLEDVLLKALRRLGRLK